MVVRSFGRVARQAQRPSAWRIMRDYQPRLRSSQGNSMSWLIDKYSSPSLVTTAIKYQHVERSDKTGANFAIARRWIFPFLDESDSDSGGDANVVSYDIAQKT